jgi:DNA repair protein RadD
VKDTATLPLFSTEFFTPDPPKHRPYQSRAIQALRDHYRRGKLRILLVAPTGAGKTVIIASIIRTSSVPVLFLAHRMELIDQCVEELRKVSITNVGVIRGNDKRENPSATVQVASISTLTRRNKPPAGIVIIDEAHRAMSDSYLNLIREFYPDSIVLGFSASPVRIDNRPLGNLFDAIEVVTTYEQLIKEGFLVAPWCYGAPEIDLSQIKITGSDFDEDQLGDLMKRPDLVGNMVDHWLKLANRYRTKDGGIKIGPYRRTFIFAVSIAHSLEIHSRFRAAGVRIEHLDGETPEKRRRSILAALGNGELDAITNVGVLLEGVDIPSAKCVVHGRPTHSLTLWRQSVGRIFRPWHPGCPKGCTAHSSVEPLLLDHAGNIGRLGFPHEDLHWSLTERARLSEKKTPTRVCSACFAYLPAYKRVCPYCGHEDPPPPPQELPREKEEELKQYVDSPEEMRRMYFNMIVQVARQKGYKPGFASARFKTRYGMWPPFEWSNGIKAKFASDPEWQANYAKKLELKKKIEAQKMAKELAKIEAPEEDE